MEFFVLGLILGVGASRSKSVAKALARGYLAAADRTQDVMAHMREDMRDAIEEARYERDGAEETFAATGPEQLTNARAVEAQHHDPAADGAEKFNGAGEQHPASTPVSTYKSSMLRGMAKAYIVAAEKTKQTAAQIREEMRDAIEEARYEHEQQALMSERPDVTNTGSEVASKSVQKSLVNSGPMEIAETAAPLPNATRARTAKQPTVKAQPVAKSPASPKTRKPAAKKTAAKPGDVAPSSEPTPESQAVPAEA